MSLGILPAFHPELSSTKFNFEFDGCATMQFVEELDEIAFEIGTTPPSVFGDNREVPDEFDGSPDELDDILGPWDEWFSSAAGLDSFNSIIEHLRLHPDALSDPEMVVTLIDELSEFARVLAVAVHERSQFRLWIAT